MDWDTGNWTWNQEKPKKIKNCRNDEICECKTTWCDEDAMCHDKNLISPIFPRFGLLEYTGTTTGKVAKDVDGRFYHEYSRYKYPEGWERVFELILPYYYNDAFIKYTGTVNNRTCQHQLLNVKTNDRRIFETYRSPKSYRKVFEGHDDEGLYVQRWELKYYSVDPWWGVYDTATYTYLYDKRTNVGVPYRYVHYYKDDTTERTVMKKYTYKPFLDDRVFDVVRYCKGSTYNE